MLPPTMRRDPHELGECRYRDTSVDVVHEDVDERRGQMGDADQEDLYEQLKWTRYVNYQRLCE